MAQTMATTAGQLWTPLKPTSTFIAHCSNLRHQVFHTYPPKSKLSLSSSNSGDPKFYIPKRTAICRCTKLFAMATEGFNPPAEIRPTELQKPRDVSTEAGRSKKKGGQGSSGRLEGRAKQRRAQEMIAERRRRLKAERAQELPPRVRKPSTQSPLHSFLYGDDNEEEEELTEDDLQMVGLGYERTVRFKDKDDPSLQHPHDWYKHGPYGPHAYKGVVVGKPVKGRWYHDRVSMFTSVKDREEQERIDQYDAVVDYDGKIETFDETIGVRYFWAFVRKTFRDEPLMPWDEWTLVSQVAVESGEDLDKYRVGHMVGKRARDLVTKCTAWFRPDLIYVKKPMYQVRFEPQEEFFRKLVALVDPLTEEEHRFYVEGEMGTYYGCLCRILGVDQSASDDDVVKGYEELEDRQRSLCWDFVFSNHPVQLLHPFTKGWRSREQTVAAAADEDSDGENAEEEEDSGDEEVGQGSFAQQKVFWEKQFEKTLRDYEEEEFIDIEDSEMNEEEGEITSEEGEMEFYSGSGNQTEPLDNRAPQAVEGDEAEKNETGNYSTHFVRSAVRPFTYKNLIREIALLRHTLLEQRNYSREPIRFV